MRSLSTNQNSASRGSRNECVIRGNMGLNLYFWVSTAHQVVLVFSDITKQTDLVKSFYHFLNHLQYLLYIYSHSNNSCHSYKFREILLCNLNFGRGPNHLRTNSIKQSISTESQGIMMDVLVNSKHKNIWVGLNLMGGSKIYKALWLWIFEIFLVGVPG